MKNWFNYLLLPLLAASCAGTDLDLPEARRDAEGNPIYHEMIVLGSQLEDPYSVENMTKALASVYPTKAERVVIPATHHYVRFLPADDGQFHQLEQLGVQLMDHPVDYEILREGDYYHDPAVSEDHITWQYAVLPADAQLPAGIRCEMLDECFIPDAAPVSKSDGVDWEAVEREAFRLTGNADLLAESGTKAGESGTPKGRITILDSAFGVPEGVRGVKVSCNTFVKFDSAFTDKDGNYAMHRNFTSRPRYRLVFNNSCGFSIGFNLLLVPASISTLGKNEASGTDVLVDGNSDRKLYSRCAVNNAGYDYWQRCSADSPGIKTPPANLRLWLFQGLGGSCAAMLQQGVLLDGSALATLMGEYLTLLKIFLPDITLGLKGWSSYGDIYATAVHEFAHASHFMKAGKSYWNDFVLFVIKSYFTSGFVTYGVGTEENHGHCEVGEMWAYFMEALLYRERYGDTGRTFGLNHWFHPQIFLQLEDRGLSCHKIFQVLDEEVTDRSILQRKLISFYPEYKSEINQVFARYN